eukprot:Skav220055  [mRNA]  locus=scaffold2981:514713:520858:- [translate_table: standard]
MKLSGILSRSQSLLLERLEAMSEGALDRYRSDCEFAVNVVPGEVQPGQRAPAETGYLTLTWNCPRNDDRSETGELMLSIAALTSLVPLNEKAEMQTFFRERKVQGETMAQAGLQVIYETIDQLQLAYKELRWSFCASNVSTGRTGGDGGGPDHFVWILSGHGCSRQHISVSLVFSLRTICVQEWKQPGPGQLDVPTDMLNSLRCDITFQAVVSVHKAIAEYFDFQCSDGKSCHYSDCKKWHEGERFAEPAEMENPLLEACHACNARHEKLGDSSICVKCC